MPSLYEQLHLLFREGKTREALHLFEQTSQKATGILEDYYDKATANFPIRQAILTGNTAVAIQLMLRTDSVEGLSLLQRFATAGLQWEQGMSSVEEWHRAQMDICSDMLELPWMKDSDNLQVTGVTNKSPILQLLHRRQTEQALALCEGLGDAYLLLQMHLHLARNQSGLGLIESEYWEVAKSKINYTLQEMLEELPDEKPPKIGLLGKIRKLLG
jgi:hypothetical protein